MKAHRHLPSGLICSLAISLCALSGFAQNERSAPPIERQAAMEAAEGVRMRFERERAADAIRRGDSAEAVRRIEAMRSQVERRQQEAAERRASRRMDAGPGPERHPDMQGRPAPGNPGVAPGIAKIRHLRAAAEHLAAAGYGEHAQKAREEAGRIEGEMRRAGEMKKREAEQKKAAETKRRKTEAKKPAKAEPAGEEARRMREEMNKLRREMDELRGQLRKALAEAAKRGQPEPRDER